jgi:hypothetical protein
MSERVADRARQAVEEFFARLGIEEDGSQSTGQDPGPSSPA